MIHTDGKPTIANIRLDEPSSESCKWFLLCENSATGTTPHPILGEVPTCDRCNEFASS